MGRPRKVGVLPTQELKQELSENNVLVENNVENASNIEQPRRGDPFEGLKIEDCKPYTTSKDLPPDRVHLHVSHDRKGQAIEGRTIFCGAPRFFLERNPNGSYNLIGKYKNGKGVGQRNIRTLKPRSLNQITTSLPQAALDRIKRDNGMMEVLKKNDIPIVNIYPRT